PYVAMSYSDVGYRLLSLFRYWNIIQYYYPYKYSIGEDWKLKLKKFIPLFINVSNEIEYKLAVLELIGSINDTHANIWGTDKTLRKYIGMNYVPFEAKFIENQLIVTNFYNEELCKKTGLQKGDIIKSINNISVKKITHNKIKYTSASNFPTKLRDISSQIFNTNDSMINIIYSHNGKLKKEVINAYSPEKIDFAKYYQNKDTCFRYINWDVVYLNMSIFKNKFLNNIIGSIKSSKGFIVDLRGTPSENIINTIIQNYLLPKPTDFVKFTKGNIVNPGFFTFWSGQKIGNENEDFYKGKLIILVNEYTQSNAEYQAMALRAVPNAVILGSTTAGADGNTSWFFLPGGINTAISGIGVYYPNGSETQRVGIVPDIEVKPTIKGIIEGRDEILERAVDIINNNKSK
ncbi:MAG: S41 family peptidase, partial [Bacteroidales bacterium]